MKPSPSTSPTSPSAALPCITEHLSGARLKVRVKPRASRSALQETINDELHVALAAPPVDGEANTALLRLLADAIDVPKSSIVLVNGIRSRTKVVQLTGLTAMQLTERLQRALDPAKRK